MPSTYRVPITKDVTVSAFVDVVANNPAHARDLAVQLAHSAPHMLQWEPDDCIGGEPYFAGDDDLEMIECLGS